MIVMAAQKNVNALNATELCILKRFKKIKNKKV